MHWTNPFEMRGRWLKGNLHTHTTRSDGSVGVDERLDAYREAGYDFIALTDHFVVSSDAGRSTSEFLVLDGVECHAVGPELGEVWHLVGIDVPPALPVDRAMSVEEIKAVLLDAGALTVFAHPYWSGNTVQRSLNIYDGLWAMEVFNATTLAVGKGTSRVHWDDALDWGVRLHGVAVDDCHHGEGDTFMGWVMVRAQALTREAVVDALRRGAFYSTTGPRIEEVTITDGHIRVRCSPATSVTFIAQRYHGRRFVAEPGYRLHEAHYRFTGEETYVRIEVWDAAGGTAWTNPIYCR
ncbi:MAG: CehA/McbA family metallohydrolase [Verrucomicrobia bacterium]|nr:CehA/McbA family metallohydrolase [Verrucomicrobiota bacterium]